jgi:hypothetical protein
MERQGGCSKTNSLSDEGKRKKVEKSPNGTAEGKKRTLFSLSFCASQESNQGLVEIDELE